MFRYISICVLAVCFSTQLFAAPTFVHSAYSVEEYRLSNGMKVLLAPMRDMGIIHVDLVYLAGSADDPITAPGTAHFLEHMVFTGTKSRSTQQILNGLHGRGIQFNATTNYDRTRYSSVVSTDKEKLEFVLALEAERMREAAFSESDMKAELEVIRQEKARFESNSVALLSQKVLSAAWHGGSYGDSVLGSYEDLKQVTVADMRKFYADYYHPNNAVLVLTGGFDKAHALASVEQYFGGIKPSIDGLQDDQYRAPKVIENEVQLHQDDLNVVMLGYELPANEDARNDVVMVIEPILVAEPSGRIYQSLVLSGKAQAVFVVPVMNQHTGLLLIGATINAEQSRQVVIDELHFQLTQLQKTPVSNEELLLVQAVQRNLKTHVFNDSTSLSETLSESVAKGDWGLSLRRLDQVEFTEASLQQGLKALLSDRTAIVGHLYAAQDSTADTDHQDSANANAHHSLPIISNPDIDTLTEQPQAVTPPDVAQLNRHVAALEKSIQRSELSNGMKVALRPLSSRKGLVHGRLNLRFGNLENLYGTQAVSNLAGTLIINGSKQRDFQALVDRVNQLGASLHVLPKQGRLQVSFTSPPENLHETLSLIAETLREPAFPEAPFHLLKDHQMRGFMTPESTSSTLVEKALRHHTEQHYDAYDIRRALDPKVMLTLLEDVTNEDVKKFHKSYYGAQHGEIAISGNFDPQQARKVLESLFGDWISEAAYEPIILEHQYHPPVRKNIRSNTASGYYHGRLYFSANQQLDEDVELFIIEHILGRNPLASRLGKRIREQEQLSYDMRSSIRVPSKGDYAFVSIKGDFAVGNGQRLSDIVEQEVFRIANAGITPYELDLAKANILNGRHQSILNDNKILNLLLRQMNHGETFYDWIERNNQYANARLDEVNATAKRYFRSDGMVEIIADSN